MKSKCSKTEHVFEGEERKCSCGKADIWWYPCNMCSVPRTVRVPGMTCDTCMNTKEFKEKMRKIKEENDRRGPSFSVKTTRDAIAFGHDKRTGQPLAVDSKGKTFDPGNTRYTKQNDPHGWKATDKVKPKKYTIT